MVRSFWHKIAGPIAVLAVTVCCATQKVELPEFSGPSVTSSVTTGSTIGISPTPNPQPTPSPTPGPTPTPASSPTPLPRQPSGSCSLPPGTGDGENCDRTVPSFLADVEASIDELIATHPELFDLSASKCGNCYRVLDPLEFTNRMVETVTARGLCARYDGEELAVKNTNDFNDQYDILTADLFLRRGDGAYRSTCRPAVF